MHIETHWDAAAAWRECLAQLSTAGVTLSFVLVSVALLATSCQRTTSIEYESISLEDLRRMASFDAEIEAIDITETLTSGTIVVLGFTKADGTRMAISQFPADDLLVEFAGSLKEGETYRLPDTLLEFEDERSVSGGSAPEL